MSGISSRQIGIHIAVLCRATQLYSHADIVLELFLFEEKKTFESFRMAFVAAAYTFVYSRAAFIFHNIHANVRYERAFYSLIPIIVLTA